MVQPVFTYGGENVLKSLLERSFEFSDLSDSREDRRYRSGSRRAGYWIL